MVPVRGFDVFHDFNHSATQLATAGGLNHSTHVVGIARHWFEVKLAVVADVGGVVGLAAAASRGWVGGRKLSCTVWVVLGLLLKRMFFEFGGDNAPASRVARITVAMQDRRHNARIWQVERHAVTTSTGRTWKCPVEWTFRSIVRARRGQQLSKFSRRVVNFFELLVIQSGRWVRQ